MNKIIKRIKKKINVTKVILANLEGVLLQNLCEVNIGLHF